MNGKSVNGYATVWRSWTDESVLWVLHGYTSRTLHSVKRYKFGREFQRHISSEWTFFMMLSFWKIVLTAAKKPHWANHWQSLNYHRYLETLDNDSSLISFKRVMIAWIPSNDSSQRRNEHWIEPCSVEWYNCLKWDWFDDTLLDCDWLIWVLVGTRPCQNRPIRMFCCWMSLTRSATWC